jgi:hypothetical protein|nr:hypothetical protein [Neorhizobium tomejilense]
MVQTETGFTQRLFLSRQIRYDLLLGAERQLRLRAAPEFRIVRNPSSDTWGIEFRDTLPVWRTVRKMWNDPVELDSEAAAEAFTTACLEEYARAAAMTEAEALGYVRTRVGLLFNGSLRDEPSCGLSDAYHGDVPDYVGLSGEKNRARFLVTPRYRIEEHSEAPGSGLRRYEFLTRGLFPMWRKMRFRNFVPVFTFSRSDAEAFVASALENFLEAKAYTAAEAREMQIRWRYPSGRPAGTAKRIQLPHEASIKA